MNENNCLIFAYTRKQALADGVLIDVTPRAVEAGFSVPVALTSAAWKSPTEQKDRALPGDSGTC